MLLGGAVLLAQPLLAASKRKPPRPDLAVAKIANPPPTLAVGGAFDAADTTKNRGKARTRKSTTRYYLSLDRKKGKGDVLLRGTRTIKALTPGKSHKGKRRVTVPQAPAGSYYLLGCADDGRKVRESNEKNN